MTPRIKSTLVVIGTLLVGIVLGGFLTVFIIHPRPSKPPGFRTRDGFVKAMEDVIEPTDDVQKAAIDSVLRPSSVQFEEVFRRHRAEFRRMFDSMSSQLRPVLSPEQQGNLQHWLQESERKHR